MSVPTVPNLASVDDLDAAIQRLACHQSAIDYRMLLLIREFDDRFGWAKWAFSSCAEWLTWRVGIGLSAAREKVRVAHALRDLPTISEAFEHGRLSYSKVRALTRAADASNEQTLLDFALSASASQVEERCRQLRNAHRDSAEQAARAWARRALSVFRHPSRHTMTISIELPLEAGELVERALSKAVQSGDIASGPEFGEPGWHAQQADALVAMAKAYLAAAPAGEVAREQVEGPIGPQEFGCGPVAADHYQVVVHVDEAALRGGVGLSEMPIETIRRLACDASITVVTEDQQGNPLNVGRKHRIVPPRLRRALWARDRGCTFPACKNKKFVEAHHLKHWTDGGETSANNTVLLCSHHHRLVHEGALQIRRLADGSLEFRRSNGQAIPRCGYRAEDAAPDPAILADFDSPSAEAWLAALLARRNRAARIMTR